MSERQYKQCPVCRCILRLNRFERHMSQQHASEAQIKPSTQMPVTTRKNTQTVEKKSVEKQNIEPIPMVKCPTCKKQVRETRLARHMRKVHDDWSMPLPSPPKLPKKTKKVKIGKLPDRERKRQLRILFGPDRETSDDIFDRGLVVSGGGYGLGKSRAH